ncbi:MAG: leucyl/phenylalanyl-tRNA--protein transferase [Bacteroidetes bacterium]|nr:leucyl/phenylalanyl-tRNA--protein transferase [Bacteroidota bacterium]
MPLFQLSEELIFPNPEMAEEDGLLAIGGDLSPERLLLAYANGIFPWFNEGDPLLWWSLNPRLILFPDEFKCNKSLKRTINSNKYEVKFDCSFDEVIGNCSKVRRNDDNETWITDKMITAYIHLHKLGFAHSAETYYQGKLVGGLYGVSLGKMFVGESMFHLMADASKVAFYHLNEKLKEWNFHFIDAQQPTSHLKSLGARELERSEFLRLLEKAMLSPTKKGNWSL